MAVHTEDHPLEYLEFEGDIPKGELRRRHDDDLGPRHLRGAQVGRRARSRSTLHGERVRGPLRALPARQGRAARQGLDDPPDGPAGGPGARADARAGSCRCSPGSRTVPPDDERWAFEIKWDGVRALAYSEPGRLRFESRNGNDITRAIPSWRASTARSARTARSSTARSSRSTTEGRPSFGALQRRMHIASEAQVEAAGQGVARSPTSSSTCCGSTGTRSWACPTRSAASAWQRWS